MLLLIVVVVGGVFFHMDSIAKAAIERGGNHALGVDVLGPRPTSSPSAGASPRNPSASPSLMERIEETDGRRSVGLSRTLAEHEDH